MSFTEQEKQIIQYGKQSGRTRKETMQAVSNFRQQQSSNVSEQETANFQRNEPSSFLGKARDFTVNLMGGGKLAEGAGQALASKEVKSQRDQTTTQLQQQQDILINKLNQQRQAGEDTTQTENALRQLQTQFQGVGETAEAFSDSLPSTTQVVGSGARLGALLGTGALSRGAGRLTGVGNASGALPTGIRAGGAGILAGGVEGAIQGAGAAAELDGDASDITTGGVVGAGIGGVLGGGLGFAGGAGVRMLQKHRNTKEVRNNLIQEGASDSRTAQYFVDGRGRIKTDPVAREAIKQGMDEGTVALIKGSTAMDRQKMQEAFEVYQKAKTDKRFGVLNRPSDVVGGSVMNRFNTVKEMNREAASQLDTVAQGLKGQEINPRQALLEFADDLSDLDINITNAKASKAELFKGSTIEGVTPAENFVWDLVERMKNTPTDDAWQLHKFKKFIDEKIAAGRTEGLAGQTKVIAQRMRKNIDDILDENFSAYNQANTQYADTIQALNDFQDVAGSNFNPGSENASNLVGTLLRRVTGNAQSRVPLIDSIQKLENTALKYGKNFDDDVFTQVDFINEMERLLGPAGKTSFQGQITQAMDQTSNILRGNTMWQTAGNLTQEALEVGRGVNQEALETAIQRLLQQQ